MRRCNRSHYVWTKKLLYMQLQVALKFRMLAGPLSSSFSMSLVIMI